MIKLYCQKKPTGLIFLLFTFCLFYSSSALSSDVNDAAVQQYEQIIQQQQQRQNAEQNDIEQQREHFSIESDYPELPQDLPQTDQCFQVTTIELLGADLLSPKKQEKLLAPFLNQCLSLADINKVLQQVTRHYFNEGYVTTRAYLPQQNLTSGQLIIQVIEGQVEGVDKTQAPEVTLFSAFPGIQHNPLNLRDIEQGIEQLNRLGQNNVRMELVPGSEVGNTVIQLANERKRRWQANLRVDNSGQPSTGEYLTRAYMSFDDPLSLNDFWYLSFQSDTLADKKQYSRNLSLHWDVPYGYWMLSADASWFDYASEVDGAVESFETSGDSQSQTLKLSRILTRSSSHKIEAISSVVRKENANYVEDVKLDTSSRVLTVADLKLRHQAFLSNGKSLQSSLGYKRGVPWLGSIERQSAHSPNPEYSALVADVSFNGNLQWMNRRWGYGTQWSAQYSNDNLFGSEQFSIGGQYSVRGFKGESVSANTGVFSRNDLSVTLPLPNNPLGLRSATPSLGIDVGAVFDDADYQDLLSGVALSMALGSRYMSTEFTYARALARPGSFSDSANQIYFSMTFKL